MTDQVIKKYILTILIILGTMALTMLIKGINWIVGMVMTTRQTTVRIQFLEKEIQKHRDTVSQVLGLEEEIEYEENVISNRTLMMNQLKQGMKEEGVNEYQGSEARIQYYKEEMQDVHDKIVNSNQVIQDTRKRKFELLEQVISGMTALYDDKLEALKN